MKKDFEKDTLALLFPHFFPYGLGSPAMARKPAQSFEATLKRLVQLSTRQFQSPTFILQAYDMLSQQKAAKNAFIIAKSHEANQKSTNIGMNDIMRAAAYLEALQRNVTDRTHLPDCPTDTGKAFWHEAKYCSSAMAHSHEKSDQAKTIPLNIYTVYSTTDTH